MSLLPCLAKADATVAWDPATGLYSLAWDAIDPSTTTADVSYRVYMDFGKGGASTLRDTVYQNKAVIDPRTYTAAPPNYSMADYGSYSFRVVSYDSMPPHQSFTVLNHVLPFISNLARGDAAGSQVGRNQQWNSDVWMQSDAKVYAAVYPLYTTFTPTDATNTSYTASALPIKVIYDNVSFSGVGTSDNHYTIPWDSRDSTGKIVANGIYQMMIRTSDNGGARDTRFMSFPVDIMRFMSLSATGITASAPQATVTYDINAPGWVTILFCTPDTRFVQATGTGSMTLTGGDGVTYTYTYAKGDNLPADANGAPNQARLLRVMKFSREAGAHTENWTGTDQSNVVLARGIYPFAITMRDDYGNVAVTTSGSDGPIAGTIAIDFNSPSSGGGGGGGGGGGDISPPVIGVITPANNITVTNAVASVSVVITDVGSGINSAASRISVRRNLPAPVITLPGTQSYDPATGALTYSLSTPLGRADNGSYAIVITAVDVAGNSIGTLSNFTVTIVDPNVFATGTPIYSYPNPVNDPASGMSFHFETTRALPMTLQVFNILGELIHEESFTTAAGPQSHPWDLTNRGGERLSSGVYIYRLKGEDSLGKMEIKKKFVVIR